RIGPKGENVREGLEQVANIFRNTGFLYHRQTLNETTNGLRQMMSDGSADAVSKLHWWASTTR
ncbi:hypothetical protein MKW98_016293, partial [Papaver atlanticum]